MGPHRLGIARRLTQKQEASTPFAQQTLRVNCLVWAILGALAGTEVQSPEAPSPEGRKEPLARGACIELKDLISMCLASALPRVPLQCTPAQARPRPLCPTRRACQRTPITQGSNAWRPDRPALCRALRIGRRPCITQKPWHCKSAAETEVTLPSPSFPS